MWPYHESSMRGPNILSIFMLHSISNYPDLYCVVVVLYNRWHICDCLKLWILHLLHTSKFKGLQPCGEKHLSFSNLFISYHYLFDLIFLMINEMKNNDSLLLKLSPLCCHGPLSAQHLILDLICWSWWWMIKK